MPDVEASLCLQVWRHPRGFAWWLLLRVAGLSLSRGFSLCWLTHARMRIVAFFIWAHSQRETWARPRPTGSLTVLGNGGSALPWVSTCLLLFTRPPSVVTWDCASSFAPPLLSRAPRSGSISPLWPLPSVSPFQTQGVSISLTRLLLVVHNTTLTRHHSSSLCSVTPSVAS